MDNERSSGISIGGQEYEMLLTTKATKEIAKRYGGLSNLGEKLMKTENFEMALDEVVWLMPIGHLLDQWEVYKQFNGLAKAAREYYIDEIIPNGI